jgi:hypothetical protein
MKKKYFFLRLTYGLSLRRILKKGMEDDLLSEYGKTEIDTFKIMANSDMVDWSRRMPELKKTEEWGGEKDQPFQSVKYEDEETEAVKEPSPRAPSPPSQQFTPPPRQFPTGTVLRDELISGEYASYPPASYRRSVSKTPPLPRSRSNSPPTQDVRVEMQYPRSLDYEDVRQEEERPREEKRTPVKEPSPRTIPKRMMPQPKKYTASEENDDYEIKAEKEGLLQELHTFSRPPHSIKMTREWNIELHTLDELQYELDRINSELNANGIVDMAKSGIKFGVSGLEMFLKQQGIDSVDGWYANSCKDMSKFNRPLLRLYKKYWRNTNMSPMMELGYLLFGGLVWTVVENKMGFKKPAPSSSTPSSPPASKPEDVPSHPKMRPPSSSGFSLPKWGASESSASSSPSVTSPSVPPAPSSSSEKALGTAAPFEKAPTEKAPTDKPQESSASQDSRASSEKPQESRASEELIQTKAELAELVGRQRETEEALKKMNSDNALMIQMLQQLATTRIPTPKQSPRSSPREIRLPLGKRSTKRTPRMINKEEEDDSLSL